MNKNIKILVNYFLGPLLFIWLSVSIYHQIMQQPNKHEAWQHVKLVLTGKEGWKFWIVLLLMFLNWSIESLKWQMLINPVQKISYLKAMASVLSGAALSINTPNRIGEYGGRIFYIEEGNRLKAISLAILGSMSQLAITLIMGIIGLLFLKFNHKFIDENSFGSLSIWINVLIYAVCILVFLLLLLYFKIKWIVILFEKISSIQQLSGLVIVLKKFTAIFLIKILTLSFIRYLVFLVQYFLILQFVKVNVSWIEVLNSVSVLFLILAIIPTIALADLGIRGKAAGYVIGLFSSNVVGIYLCTFIVWFVNIVIPAIVGSILILRVRMYKKKNSQLLMETKIMKE